MTEEWSPSTGSAPGGPPPPSAPVAPVPPVEAAPVPPVEAVPPRVSAPPPPAAARVPESDWVNEVLDRLDFALAQVRSKTTTPLVTGIRGLVFGLIAGVAAITALVLVAIAFVRLADNLLPGDVWVAYLLIGAVFLIAGLLLMSRRAPREAQ